jgi:arylsulfatase A-like enzyme
VCNGPCREGKGSPYEGGTRVITLANWHVRSGATVDGIIHVVDMYPTIAALAGASTTKAKPLDGLNMWPTIVTPAITCDLPVTRVESVFDLLRRQ